jgi:hypothetical protein
MNGRLSLLIVVLVVHAAEAQAQLPPPAAWATWGDETTTLHWVTPGVQPDSVYIIAYDGEGERWRVTLDGNLSAYSDASVGISSYSVYYEANGESSASVRVLGGPYPHCLDIIIIEPNSPPFVAVYAECVIPPPSDPL